MNEPLPELSKAEWAIMKRIWQLKRASVRELHEALGPIQGWAYNTVRTMVERLREKGYLTSSKQGNLFVYEPTITRQATTRRMLNSFAEKVLDGALGPIVSQLIREERLTDDELSEIRELLDRKKQ